MLAPPNPLSLTHTPSCWSSCNPEAEVCCVCWEGWPICEWQRKVQKFLSSLSLPYSSPVGNFNYQQAESVVLIGNRGILIRRMNPGLRKDLVPFWCLAMTKEPSGGWVGPSWKSPAVIWGTSLEKEACSESEQRMLNTVEEPLDNGRGQCP
jgi:hypothetical protein